MVKRILIFNFRYDLLVGKYFNFRIVPVNFDRAQIDYRDGFGTNAWNDGLTTNDAINNHIQRVDFIGTKLDLDSNQIKFLLDGASFVKDLYDFLQKYPDDKFAEDFARDAIKNFNEGGDVDFEDFDNIDDSELTDTKIKCIFDLLKSKGNPFVKSLFANFTEPGSEWSIKIGSPRNVRTDGGKIVNGIMKTSLPSKVFSIDIGSTAASNRSTLEVARTIIHEFIHAEVNRRRFTTTPTADDLAFRKVYGEYTAIEDGGDPGHNALVDYYLDDLAQALMNFHSGVLVGSYNQAISEFEDYDDPRFPKGKPGIDFYRNIAWSGAGYTGDADNIGDQRINKWKNLKLSDRQQVKNDITLKANQLTKKLKITK